MAFTYNRKAVAQALRDAGSPMTVEDIEQGAGGLVNPGFLAALALKESSFGTAGYATGSNNAYGWGIHEGLKYPNWRAGTAAVAKGLSGGLYKGAGLRSATDIINKYAPPSENNTALYQQQVNSWGRRFGFNPNDVFAGGDGAPPEVMQQVPGATSAATRLAKGQQTVSAGQPIQQLDPRAALLASRYSDDPIMAMAIQQGFTKTVTPTAKKLVGAPANPAPALLGGNSEKGQQAVTAGEGVLGTPYSWGGGSPAGPSRGIDRGANTVGFDCSSLAQYMWAKVGVKLPRTTYDQIRVGRGINAADPRQWRPGDLLFPHTGHVQVYIGNNRVIEAPFTGGRVRETGLRGKYIAVRRPVG